LIPAVDPFALSLAA